MSNLDPLNNYDTPEFQQQEAGKLVPDALTPPWQAQGFASQEQYNNAYGYQPSSTYQTGTYAPFNNDTSAINQTLGGTNTPSGVSYADWSRMSPEQQTATGAGEALAAEFGLQGLNSQVIDWVLKDGISDPNVLFQNIYASKEFKAEFPEIEQLRAKGLPVLSPQQILDTRAAYDSALASVGVSPQFLSKEQKSSLIVNGVAPTEVQHRLTNMVTTLQRFESDPSLGPQFQRLYAQGVTPGELAAYYLDPDHTEQYLNNQINAASAAARSQRTGFGDLTRMSAEDIGGLGLNDQQLSQGFGNLAQEQGLFRQGISENSQLNKDVGLQAQFFNNANANEQIQRRLQQRRAAFAGGGNFSDPNRQGLTGAGSANT